MKKDEKFTIPTTEVGLTNHEVKCLLMQIASEINDNNMVCHEYALSCTPEVAKERIPKRIACRANTGKLSISLEVVYRLSSYIG